jgi:hypothetical protein
MTFTPNIPSTGQTLGQTRDPIRDNFTNYNNTISQDHIPPNSPSPFTAGQGKHNQLTMPGYIANPVTGLPPVSTATESKYYAFQITAPLGLMQFSRTWDQVASAAAVPTPISGIQSTSAAITIATSATSNVLDFNGISTIAMGSIYFSYNLNSIQIIREYLITWTSAHGGTTVAVPDAQDVVAEFNGNILRLRNTNSGFNATEVYWTLRLHRIQ